MSIKVTIQYSNYSVVLFPHYSSSTVILTVIGVLEHHSIEKVTIHVLY